MQVFSSLLVVLFCFFCQAYAALQLQSGSTDGSYWYDDKEAGTHPSADQLRKISEDKYHEMDRLAHGKGITAPSTIAALWCPNKGVVVASSIMGSPGKQSEATKFLNECSNRYHGNCAEMNAIAMATQYGWPLKGGVIAVYGYDKHSKSYKHLSPCRNKDGKDGCEGKVPANGIRPITKRDVAVEFTA